MATKWSKDVTREVSTDKGEINATLGCDGVIIRRKGTQRQVSLSWDQVLEAADLPDNAPKTATDDVERRRKWFYGS